MQKVSCIAIDDDVVALKLIGSLIKMTNHLELLDTYSDAIKGANAIVELNPDLVFLDIQMPNLSGLDILRNMSQRPEIILVTSQRKFAVEAFEFNVTDYLVKPIEDYGRFLKGVNKALNNVNKKESLTVDKRNLFVKTDSLLVSLQIKDINYLEAYGDYVKVHTDDKIHIVYSKFKSVEDKLTPNEFVRVHRSYIVRIDKIKNIDQSNVQVGDRILPLSNTYKSVLLERITTL